MILFDYGQTLIVEPQFDWMAANLAILAHAQKLPENMTREELCRRSDELFFHVLGQQHENYREMEHVKFLRLLCDAYDITLDIPLEEADLLYWDSATHGSFASPGAPELLDYLAANGIRSGIISNMCYSNAALCARLDRYLPNNRFDFVMTSSDYILRKPESLLFAVACKRAGLTPADIWFVGDNPEADILGAYNAGMRPILYTGAHMRKGNGALPDVPFDTVETFAELQALIEKA
ncbi:MAG: HAD family hydrolase [Clostridia bacterium]|nr:HAD family hydrolase [Clostridia bacterium]